jgi:aspartate aminotransferase
VAFRPGDEVILPVPSWLDHPLYLRRHGLRAVTVPLLPDSKRLDLAAVAAALTPRTAGVLLSHPACPTGVVYRRHELEALAGLLASPTDDGRPRVLLSDEVHGEHVWGADDDAPDGGFTSAAAVHPHTISTYSFGKAWVMQGQRAGFVAVSPHMADHDAVAQRVVRSLRSTGVYAPTSVMQLVAARLARLTPDNRALAADQRHVRSALGALGYRVVPAEATAFVYVRCPDGWGGDDVAFVERLAEHGLLVMPSTLFHEPGHVRLVLNVGRSELDEALTILAKEA